MSHPLECRASLDETGPFRRVWRFSGITSAIVEWRLDRRGPLGLFGAERVLVNGIVVYLEPRLLPGAGGLLYFDLPSSEGVLPARIERCVCQDGVTALSLSITKTALHLEGDLALLHAPLVGYPVPASAPAPTSAELPRPAAGPTSDPESHPIPADAGSGPRVALRGLQGCEVALEVLRGSGGDRLDCHISVVLASVSASFRTSLDLDSLVRFQQELSAAHRRRRGAASLRPPGDRLALEVEITQSDHARVRGIARQGSPAAALTFEFETGRSDLRSTCGELSELLKVIRAGFPV